MKQVCYRKIKSGAFAGDVFAIFPEYRNGEVSCFDPVGGFGSMSLEYFTDCTEDATPEESAKVRAFLENMGYMLESVNLEKLMETAFEKRDFYRLPCDQYGQPFGNIETHSLTVGEYACKKRADREALTALWFDNYAVAAWRADN